MRKNSFLVIFLLGLLFSCGKVKEVATLECTKKIDFGTIKVKDTVMKTFILKNVSSVPLKIKKINPSCGCTIAKLKDSIVKENSSTEVAIQFIAKKNSVGKFSKSIVIDANTEPNFTVLYLIGNIEK